DIYIPENIQAITYRIVAKANNFADGEEMTIPVIPNKILITESLPLPINGKQTKTFYFTKLAEANKSSTLKHHKLIIEYTSNPAWYAIQALPYMMEYPYECSEQIFSRYYANTIASYIVNSNPKFKAVFDTWRNYTPDALISNMEKNQELKNLIIEETPWLLEAQNETERKQKVALLFDLNIMSNELQNAEKLLIKKQSPNGGWPWFEGMPENRYITQYIIAGFGHLKHMGIITIQDNKSLWNTIIKGIKYLDNKIREDYEYIKKWNPTSLNENNLSYEHIQYLYARSFFIKDISINKINQEAYDYFIKQAEKYWIKNNIYMQGMISLALYRNNNNNKTSKDIIKSLKEKALYSESMGMYWQEISNNRYYWYSAPIETQALLIEAFDEITNDTMSIEKMKIWLLKQKQTQNWKTTKATTEACYALLLKGKDPLANTDIVEMYVGKELIEPYTNENVTTEAGTGYYKTSWNGNEITPDMSKITITKKDEGIGWGAAYWQYFEQLDKISYAETPIKIDKKLFKQINSPTGPKLEPISDKTNIKIGDKIIVRIIIKVDCYMEYIHMKDMRAAGFEPVNVLSGYKYNNGIYYYESTRDASTNFFF
ncbi:MAG TPA: hypothetical protein P5250_08465, partial [Bacteroidales bacterium]|nr:hypothetical protein [Bacteroidales bacterium]